MMLTVKSLLGLAWVLFLQQGTPASTSQASAGQPAFGKTGPGVLDDVMEAGARAAEIWGGCFRQRRGLVLLVTPRELHCSSRCAFFV